MAGKSKGKRESAPRPSSTFAAGGKTGANFGRYGEGGTFLTESSTRATPAPAFVVPPQVAAKAGDPVGKSSIRHSAQAR